MGQVRLGFCCHDDSREDVWQYMVASQPGIVTWENCGQRGHLAAVRSWGGLNYVRHIPAWDVWAKIVEYGPFYAAERYVAEMWTAYGPDADLIDGYIAANEIWGGDKQEEWQNEAFYQFNREFGRLCRGRGVKSLSTPCGVGNPEPAQWAYLKRRCREDGMVWMTDVLAVHEYWQSIGGPTDWYYGYDPDAPNRIGRFCLLGELPGVPVLVSETGYVNLNADEGYRLHYRGDIDTVFAGHLEQLLNLYQMLADKYQTTIIGATAFEVGYNDKWVKQGHDFTGIWQIRDLCRGWPKQHDEYPNIPATEPEPQPQEEAPVEFFGRFAAMAAQMGEKAGVPISPAKFENGGTEYANEPGNAWQMSSTGGFYYDCELDEAYFTPYSHKMGGDGVLAEMASPFAEAPQP